MPQHKPLEHPVAILLILLPPALTKNSDKDAATWGTCCGVWKLDQKEIVWERRKVDRTWHLLFFQHEPVRKGVQSYPAPCSRECITQFPHQALHLFPVSEGLLLMATQITQTLHLNCQRFREMCSVLAGEQLCYRGAREQRIPCTTCPMLQRMNRKSLALLWGGAATGIKGMDALAHEDERWDTELICSDLTHGRGYFFHP